MALNLAVTHAALQPAKKGSRNPRHALTFDIGAKLHDCCTLQDQRTKVGRDSKLTRASAPPLISIEASMYPQRYVFVSSQTDRLRGL
jgi:hypothetical protein